MKRALRYALAVACATFGLTASAHASTVYTSIFDPTDVLFNRDGGACTGSNDESGSNDTVSGFAAGACTSLGYDHTLVGYSNPPDNLLSADLKLYFYDDADPGLGNPESVLIELTGLLGQLITGEIPLTSNGSDVLSYAVLFAIGSDGLLHVFLELGGQGIGQADFMFDKSTLTGEWDDVLSIPEPTSLLLFGTGLTAAAARLRRRTRKNA